MLAFHSLVCESQPLSSGRTQFLRRQVPQLPPGGTGVFDMWIEDLKQQAPSRARPTLWSVGTSTMMGSTLRPGRQGVSCHPVCLICLLEPVGCDLGQLTLPLLGGTPSVPLGGSWLFSVLPLSWFPKWRIGLHWFQLGFLVVKSQ